YGLPHHAGGVVTLVDLSITPRHPVDRDAHVTVRWRHHAYTRTGGKLAREQRLFDLSHGKRHRLKLNDFLGPVREHPRAAILGGSRGHARAVAESACFIITGSGRDCAGELKPCEAFEGLYQDGLLPGPLARKRD